MRLLDYWRALRIFVRFIPWVDEPQWTEGDAAGLQTYLKSESGAKLKLWLLNYVLRLQADAVSQESNLTYRAGACQGAKALISALETLAEPQNYTEEIP